jgi:cation-transporting P-type ATPase I
VDLTQRVTRMTRGLLHRQRRVWARDGHAHIEYRDLPADQVEAFVAAVGEALAAHEAVERVDVLTVEARVVVVYDEAWLTVVDLVRTVERVEQGLLLATPPHFDDRPDHPADREPVLHGVVELAADVVGLGLAVVGRARRAVPLPIELDLAWLGTVVENVPRLRGAVERRLGTRGADLALSVTNSVLAGLTHGVSGPLVDIAHQTVQLRAVTDRRDVWERREPDLVATPRTAAPALREPRPVPLPDGPIERYANKAWIASLGAFGVGLALTGSIEQSATALIDALPKAARLGRSAFAASVASALADRDILVMDAAALERLDRVDCVVLEENTLRRPALTVAVIEPIGDVDPADATGTALTLFELAHPRLVREGPDGRIGPLDRLDVPIDDDVATRAHALGVGGWPVLGVARDDRLIALVGTQPELSPESDDLLAVAGAARMRTVLRTGESGPALAVDELTTGAAPEAVRRLQLDGHVVAYVGDDEGALAAADLGIGVPRDGGPTPWGAHLITTSDLRDAYVALQACGVGRRASRDAIRIAMGGAGIGALVALSGLRPGTSRRVMRIVNAASLLAIANGARLAGVFARLPVPEHPDATPWHALPPDLVLDRLESSADGLTTEAARSRWIAPVAPPSSGVMLGTAMADELRNPLTPILVGGAGLSVATGAFADAVMVVAVMGLNVAVGGAQRFRTDRAISRLDRHQAPPVRVRRDSREQTVDADALVPGDVVLLDAGDAVPADCRILTATGIEVDEAALTGESLPVPKTPASAFTGVVAERASMLYDGTAVATGEATAVVVATGRATEARRAMIRVREDIPETGVEARLEGLTRLTAPLAVAGGAVLAASGLARHRSLPEVLGAGVSLAVAAVPEGLPLLATVAQLGAARRLSHRGALVRNPRAVEALGRVDVLCADKTGTLTEGRIELTTVSDGITDRPLGEVTGPGGHRRVLVVARRATPIRHDRELPHPTDRAIADGTTRSGIQREDGGSFAVLDEIPFEPTRGYHAVLGETDEGRRITVKGAPETILARCDRWHHPDDGVRELTGEEQLTLHGIAAELADRGLRVLAVADRPAQRRGLLTDEAVRQLRFRGFLGLADPVRPTAAAAATGLERAGVQVVMITGDHPATARGIARELGILDGGSVLTGPDLEDLDDDALDLRLHDVAVFARVTPAHKVRIVRAFQRQGRTVAMTGDGANDAAAIRLADVGIALGSRATAAAREAADMVVVDDRIETIVDAIAEGRGLWTSVRDAVAVLVGGNLGEIGFTVLGALLTGQSPINARQLLLVNLLTDVAPAMAIALRPPTTADIEELLREGPEASLGESLDRAIAWRAIGTAAAAGGAYLAGRLSGRPARARTMALVALVGAQLGQTAAAGFTDPRVLAASLGSGAALLVLVETPGVSNVLGSTPLGPVALGVSSGFAAAGTAMGVLLPRTGIPLALPRRLTVPRRWSAAPVPGSDGVPAG